MPTLPDTTAAFATSATEAQFKTFLSDQRAFIAYMLGASGDPNDSIVSGFPAGTSMLFAQAASPTGWTKQTTHNDKALRVVSGMGGGSGGTSAFSTVFGRTATDGSSLSIAQLASHTHPISTRNNAAGISGSASSAQTIGTAYSTNTSSTGSGSTHSHGMDLRVQYVDVIIAIKD